MEKQMAGPVFSSWSRSQKETVTGMLSWDVCSPYVLWWQWEMILIISLSVNAAIWFSGKPAVLYGGEPWNWTKSFHSFLLKNANLCEKDTY